MAGFNAQGTIIARGTGTGTPETFATIGEIRSFSGPGGTANVIDATTLQSTGKEKVVGLQDEGQLTLECNFNPSDDSQLLLLQDRANQTLRNFRITFSDAATTVINFSAYVLGATIAGGVDALTTMTITLEISGSVTWPTPT